MDEEINLCDEVLEHMNKLEFNYNSVLDIQENPKFVSAYSQPPQVQRVMLISILYEILLRGDAIVPSEIRTSLNLSTCFLNWLDDIKLVILPFMKLNEDKFFSS